ncbi:hypothetical protein A3Q56_01025 [Intoshia linei]|uniref:Glucosamine 6-phosphate N-acetyltransferase n=1 Tax=Intoshia linei TaxID=1819745 RepID=A0A177BBZ9_9BILA|nr:hypothetical protein A3Q56_01025 [Intoshia linei]
MGSSVFDISDYLNEKVVSDLRRFYELLSQLTHAKKKSFKEFSDRFDEIFKTGDNFICIIEIEKKIVATASLLIEYKFTRDHKLRGRLEDIVVDVKYRQNGFASILINILNKIGENLNCYKLSLDCFDKYKKCYQNFGYTCEDGVITMIKRIGPQSNDDVNLQKDY